MWRHNVWFVDAVLLCNSNMQQCSNLSGVISLMLSCICILSNLMLTDPLACLADRQPVSKSFDSVENGLLSVPFEIWDLIRSSFFQTLLNLLQFLWMTLSSEEVNFLYVKCTSSLESCCFCSFEGKWMNCVSMQWGSQTGNGTLFAVTESDWKSCNTI